MPSETQLKNANPKGGKKPPMGIPVWGWVIAAVLGIIIGYTILKKSGGATGASAPPDTSTPETPSSGTAPGGTVALPEDLMKALGLIPAGTGTSASGTTTSSFSTEAANQAALAPSISDSALQPGAPLLMPGTIVPQSGSGSPFTSGVPGGTATADPEHNAFIQGYSDVDPFAVRSPDVSPISTRNTSGAATPAAPISPATAAKEYKARQAAMSASGIHTSGL